MTVGITELPPEGMQLPGVALAGDAERGTKTTEGISLLFTASGVTVQGPQPQIERLLVWSALDSATCREKVHLPDGREAAIMELTSGGQSIRFLLPNDTVSPGQAAYLDQALPTWLARYKGVAATVPSAPATPPVDAAPAAGQPEVGVTLPAPGPHAAADADADVAPATETAPVYAAATAGAVAAAAHAVEQATDPSVSNGSMPPGDGLATGLPTMQASAPSAPTMPAPAAAAPTLQPPPAPAAAPPLASAPATPTMQAPPPPPAAPTMPAPSMPSPSMPSQAPTHAPDPAAPVFPSAPAPPVASPPPPVSAAPAAPAGPAVTAWDDPPLGLAAPVAAAEVASAKKVKKPKFALTRKQLNAAHAAAAATVAEEVVAGPAPTADQVAVAAPSFEAPKAKKPKFALTRKQLHAAEAAAAATAATVAGAAPFAAAPAPTAEAPKAKKPKFALTRKQLHAAQAAAAGTAVAGTAAASTAPPSAPPSAPVPLAVQPPAPTEPFPPQAPIAQPTGPTGAVPSTGGPLPPGGGPFPSDGAPGAGGVVLAESGSKPNNRRSLVLLVVLLVVVVAVGAGYLISKKSSSTPTTAPAVVSPGITDTALATSINLRLADLPPGWQVAPPAQAVVRPPVATAAAQASATNAMAACLGDSYAVVSGLFDSGSLPGQTSLVQSQVFQSAAGPSFEMASRTATLASATQVQALDSVFTNPKFDACYLQYRTSLGQAAVAGTTVAVQPVTLTAPRGVSSYGVVTTYTVPGAGTQVVGDAYLLGGRVVTVIQPSTSGAAIPSDVFGPAYNAVAGRVATSLTK